MLCLCWLPEWEFMRSLIVVNGYFSGNNSHVSWPQQRSKAVKNE